MSELRRAQKGKNSKTHKNISKDIKNKQKKPKSGLLWKIWCVLFSLIFIASAAVGAIAISVYLDVNKTLPGIDLAKIVTREPSRVYDAQGNEFSTLAEDAHISVSIDQVPESLKDAFLATEDVRYFRHKGIDGPRTLMALVDLVVTKNIVSGGSTITQQLVQNTILKDKMDANVDDYRNSKMRKIEEWILAYKLEGMLSKDEIMEAYLNNAISFGRFTGIGTVSKRYFNKSVSELTLAESALLAGIPQLPGENNPFQSIEGATERYNTVVSLMVRHKFLSQEEADALLKMPLADLVIRNQDEILNPNAAYLSAVQSELIKKLEIKDDNLVASIYQGYNIYTNFNAEQQAVADQIMNTNDYVDWEQATRNVYGWNTELTQDDWLNYQGAFTVVENKTGAIPAIGVSRNFSVNYHNIATEGFRSPGSSIKPVIDYAPYVEKFQASADTVLNDTVTYYSGSGQVFNYNHGGHEGYVSLKKALGDSKNTTAVRALQAVGIEYAAQMAGDMGLSKAMPLLNEGLLGESAALGGGLETTTEEMAGAYATMANGGTHIDPHTINKITNNEGKVLWEFNMERDSKRVLSESTAATMMEALIYAEGSGTPVGGGRVHVAGDVVIGAKTGTSSYAPEEGVSTSAEKDHWHISSSPDYSIATWTGLEVEGEDVLSRTGGNVNANKHWGSYMIKGWMDHFAQPGLRFDFLGSANRGSSGSIGGFEVSANNGSASWTVPGINYPSGLSDDDKKGIGGIVFDVTATNSAGEAVSKAATTDTSIDYNSLFIGNSVSDQTVTVTVVARVESENAQSILSPVSASASETRAGVGGTPEDSSDNNEESSTNQASMGYIFRFR